MSRFTGKKGLLGMARANRHHIPGIIGSRKNGSLFSAFVVVFEFKALYSQNIILILMRRAW